MGNLLCVLIFLVGLGASLWLWAVEGFVWFLVMLTLTILVSGFVAFVIEIVAAMGRWLYRIILHP